MRREPARHGGTYAVAGVDCGVYAPESRELVIVRLCTPMERRVPPAARTASITSSASESGFALAGELRHGRDAAHTAHELAKARPEERWRAPAHVSGLAVAEHAEVGHLAELPFKRRR